MMCFLSNQLAEDCEISEQFLKISISNQILMITSVC